MNPSKNAPGAPADPSPSGGRSPGLHRRDLLRLGALACAPGMLHAGGRPRSGSRPDESAAGKDGEAASRPNVLVVITDQHRFDVSGYAGDPHAHTPALDRLAKRGTTFESVYGQIPLCLPARQSLLTGRFAHEHSSFANVRRFPEGLRTLPQAFREAGYRTALIGKAHCTIEGFESALDLSELYQEFKARHPRGSKPGDYLTERPKERMKVAVCNPGNEPPGPEGGGPVHQVDGDIAQRGRRWLAEHDGERPFFLWVSFLSPHPPLFPPEEWMERYREADLPLLGGEQTEDVPALARHNETKRRTGGVVSRDKLLGIARSYYASVAWMDHCVGQVLEGLEAREARRETLVLYTSDHGEMLGEHGMLNKNIFYEGAVRVPAILAGLPGVPRGERRAQVAQHIDLSATLLDLAGIPEATSGRSLRGLLRDPSAAWEELAHAELFGATALPHREHGKFRMVEPTAISQMVREGRYKCFRYARGGEVLFDLQEDPGELRDRMQDPDLRDVQAALRARMDAHLPEQVRVLTERS